MQQDDNYDTESFSKQSSEVVLKNISKLQGLKPDRPQDIQNAQNDKSNQLVLFFQRYGFAGLMYLANFGILSLYYKVVVSNPRKRKSNQIVYKIPAIIESRFNYFLIYLQQSSKPTKKIHDSIKDSEEFKKLVKQFQSKPIQVKCKQSLKLQKLFQQYFSLLKLSAHQQKIKVKRFIQQKIRMTEQFKNGYCQSCFNWLKKSAQAMSRVDQKNLCCKIYYEELGNRFLYGYESDVQEFKNYYYPIQNDSIINHIQKTVVGFMNRNGGIIYMGLLEEKTKGVKVSGIKLQPKQKIEMRQFIQNKILTNVLPQSDFNQIYYLDENDLKFIKEYKQSKVYKEKAIEYYFNPFVSTDFTTIANPDTMINIKDSYIMRIKVRPGDPFQFYSMIGAKQSAVTQYYVRQDKSVKKMLFSEAKTQIYKRLKQKVDAMDANRLEQQRKQKINAIKPYHEGCRFSLLPITLEQIKMQKQFGNKSN